MTEREEMLLLCPFCGGAAQLSVVHENDDGTGEVEFAYTRCPSCGTQRGERRTEQLARDSWNTRAAALASSEVMDLRERLAAALDQLGKVSAQLGAAQASGVREALERHTPQKEIASVVRNAVVETLKSSAPGISETMREAIANSVMIKIRAAFAR